MTSTYDANPPNYTDPSAADDISSLISTALAVQEGLFDARQGLKRVNAARVNELLPRLVDTDERYLKLLDDSRTSAAELCNAIQNFMDVAIPISLDTQHPMEKRVAVVKKFADKIAASAHRDLQPYDQQVMALKENLDQLVLDLNAIQATLQNQPSDADSGQSRSMTEAGNIGNLSRQRHLDDISIVKFLASVLGWFVAPHAKSRATIAAAPPETTASASATVDEAVLRDVSALVVLFSGLIGKLGHFGTVWEKLVADSAELSTYLSQGIGNQDVIGNRVQAELGVYEKIKLALDDYCLRTR